MRLAGVLDGFRLTFKLKKRGEKGHVYIASQDLFPVGVDDIKAGYRSLSRKLSHFFINF